MLSVEEIKKACEFADGFEYDILIDDGEYPYVRCHNGAAHYLGDFPFHDIDFDLWKNIYYPLFLQRVIEGINNSPMKPDEPHFRIRMNCDIDNQWYEVSHGRVLADGHSYITFMFKNNNSIDQAKTQAIKYILDKI